MAASRFIHVVGIIGAVATLMAVAARGDDVAAEPARVGRPQPQQFTTDLGQLFEGQTFGRPLQAGNGAPLPADAVPDAIAAHLAPLRKRADARIDTVDRIVGLSEAQRKKLEIAVQSDWRRLIDAIAEIRAAYAGRSITTDPQVGGYDEAGQQLIQQLSQDSARCRQLAWAAFGPESLLAKVVVGTLDEKQAERYAAVMHARAACRWKAVVAAGLAACDDSLGLTQKQHDAVMELLVADPPPADDDAAPLSTAPAAVVVAGRLAGLGDEKLAAVLDPRQRQFVAALARAGEPAGDQPPKNAPVVVPAVQANGVQAVGEFRIEVR